MIFKLVYFLLVCVHVSAPYVIVGVRKMCRLKLPLKMLQCCPSGHDSSLNLLVLVSVSVAVSPSHVDVAFIVLDMRDVDIYWCVVFHHLFCV